MKSDVKAVRVTGTGAVFAGRTRLRGMILASDGGGAGVLELTTTSNTGTILFVGDVPTGDVINFSFPEDGILYKDGAFVTFSEVNCNSATVYFDG